MEVPVSDIVSGAAAPGEEARRAGKAALANMLVDARTRTLAWWAAYEAAWGPDLRVPCAPTLNPPLWELGHVGWFADWWVARHSERHCGLQANPDAPRPPARQARRGVDADRLYNSSTVAHERRWRLDLPDAPTVRADLNDSLQDTLALLRDADDTDAGLYCFRLALFHEDMHTEAAHYMAQTLGFDPTGGAPPARSAPWAPPHTLQVPATVWSLGRSGAGFCFDNELGAHPVAVGACDIDAQPVTWAQYLPFVSSGGAALRRHWSAAGWAWRERTQAVWPRYVRPAGTGWEHQRHGQWQPLDLTRSACHLTAFEAQAWCAWAGRRLPTEAEWELAAHTLPGFVWGSVWEWTASAFAPFPGFTPHLYRDYSAPWFDGRPVLKGASPATVARMRHPKYRNFYPPERNDIVAGLRSVSL